MRAKAYLLAALLAAAASAGGCAEYKYYDIDVSFNTAAPMAFMGTNDISTIQTCVVEVSGADTAEFTFSRDVCPPKSPAGNISSQMGIFEYSSTADSGQMTFTFKAYIGFAVPSCLVGQGTTTVPVGPTTASAKLVVNRINDVTACQ